VRFTPSGRKTPAVTLVSELNRLQQQAQDAHATSASGPYSRSLLAERSGVKEDTLSAWLDGIRVPQNFSNLMKVVDALADLAGPAQQSSQRWRALWDAARPSPRSGPRSTRGALKHRTQVGIASFATAAAVAVIGGFFTPIGGDLLNIFKSTITPAAAQGKLKFSLRDSSGALGLTDESVADNGIVAFSGSSWPSGVKAGAKIITLVITNDYSRTVNVSDIDLVNLRSSAAVNGTLFASGAQGEGSNDQLGVNLADRQPVLRHTNSNGTLGDPFFSDTHLAIPAHNSEILVIRVYAGAAKSYTWQFKVYYDEGDGVQWVIPSAPPNLLLITGYVHNYRRVYSQEGTAWVQKPASNFCTITGTSC